MTNIDYDTRTLIGRKAADRYDSKVGTISDVYVDDQTGQPTWLAVNTGLFGTKVHFVPLAGAAAYGDDVFLAYDKDVIKDAPAVDPDGVLAPDEEAALYTHYEMAYAGAGFTAADAETRRRGPAEVGHDVSGPNTDDAMTRSEEQLDVSKRTRPTATARLRKWIDTEDVEIRVPVRREKARLVTEPITDVNRGKAMSGPALSSEEHEVVLSEEVVDVDKRVVPKERVRLETATETDEVAVDDTVRKERIAFDHDTEDRRRTGR